MSGAGKLQLRGAFYQTLEANQGAVKIALCLGYERYAPACRRPAKDRIAVAFGIVRTSEEPVRLYPPNPAWSENAPWYSQPGIASCGQFAVEPEFQRCGLGAKLMGVVERRAAGIGATELALDTSEDAAHLIRFYVNRGYRLVGFIQHEGKTYRSVILSKRVLRLSA